MNVTYLAAADWDRLGGSLVDAIVDTLIMVSTTLVVAGILGLGLGILLYTKYLFAFEILGILLLVVAVGVVAVSRMKGGTHARH